MGENDGIFSQWLLPLAYQGYHSSYCQLEDKRGSSVRFWPLPSFHVSQPSRRIDTIPPSRITDLKIQVEHPSDATSAANLIFTWTAPGMKIYRQNLFFFATKMTYVSQKPLKNYKVA